VESVSHVRVLFEATELEVELLAEVVEVEDEAEVAEDKDDDEEDAMLDWLELTVLDCVED
jgi:hypothetical protein